MLRPQSALWGRLPPMSLHGREAMAVSFFRAWYQRCYDQISTAFKRHLAAAIAVGYSIRIAAGHYFPVAVRKHIQVSAGCGVRVATEQLAKTAFGLPSLPAIASQSPLPVATASGHSNRN